MNMPFRALTLCCCGALIAVQLAQADTTAGEAFRLENLSILGDPANVASLPGSAHYLGEPDLARFEHSDILRVLRSVPGVYIQEEEGLGLRPNIGIRGSGLDRSSRIALMEDGVLIAPAPYAAPSAYYFPTQRRMQGVEVLKGPSAVTQGPRTTGGALNLLSTRIPSERDAQIEFLTGENDFRDLHAWYGQSHEQVSWLVETVQQESDGFKHLDGGGDTGYETRDYLAKLRFSNHPEAAWYQGVELKLGYTEHQSNETYLGLTQADFQDDPYRRYAASRNDNIATEHEQYVATYFLRPASAAWELEFTAYRNDFSRNWFKLDAAGGTGISAILDDPMTFSEELAWIRGDLDSPDDALTLRNNKRSYYSQGVQGLFSLDFRSGLAVHEMDIGWRRHQDEEDRLQDDDLFRIAAGQLELTRDGPPGSQANRVSDADVLSFYVQDSISAGAWRITPGVRWERIELARRDFATEDPTRAMGATGIRENEVEVFIPGLGAAYRLSDQWLVLAGIHKGFNPPAPGSEADEEESVNYELGARYRRAALNAEAIFFSNDYDNLVGTCTVSTGGTCDVGEQFDGGEATVRGLELLVGYEASLGGSHLRVPLRLAYTLTTEAEFDNSFESDFDPWGDVRAGDELPYIPEHQLQLGADLVASRWDLRLNATYVDETRTVAGQGPPMATDRTDSFFVVDLGWDYRLSDRLNLFLRVDNLLDEEYVVAQRPAGARPGKPRTALAGFRFGL